jgi:hypothetical protein
LSKKVPKLVVKTWFVKSMLGWRFELCNRDTTVGMNRQSIRNIGCEQVRTGRKK